MSASTSVSRSRREHLAMQRRIWAACLLATPQEIHDGLSFYPGAWGLCRFFSRLRSDLSPRHVAGIYAALSPMNTWDTNVANMLDVVRWGARPSHTLPSVNTTSVNRDKALRIALAADPEAVLGGRKVLSFFRCIASPDNSSLPPAIDRHMFNLALGLHAPTKREQADIAHNPDLYTRVEAAFVDMGRREGIGNRLASICWFVQRRLERTGQRALRQPKPLPGRPMSTPDLALAAALSVRSGGPSAPLDPLPGPLCCSRPMQAHARRPRQRWYCPRCGSTRVPVYCLRLVRTPSGWERRYSTEGLKIWRDPNGRACVTIPKLHPYSNSAGYQRLARFLIAEELGYLPPPNQHTHHRNGLSDDSLTALELLDTQYHGRVHASALYVARAENGRFMAIEDPGEHGGVFDWPRRGAVLGNAARRP